MGGREQWWEDGEEGARPTGTRTGPTGGRGRGTGSPWGISTGGLSFFLVRRGSGGSAGDLVLLSAIGRAIVGRGEVWCLHNSLVSGPAGIHIIYHD